MVVAVVAVAAVMEVGPKICNFGIENSTVLEMNLTFEM